VGDVDNLAVYPDGCGLSYGLAPERIGDEVKVYIDILIISGLQRFRAHEKYPATVLP